MVIFLSLHWALGSRHRHLKSLSRYSISWASISSSPLCALWSSPRGVCRPPWRCLSSLFSLLLPRPHPHYPSPFSLISSHLSSPELFSIKCAPPDTKGTTWSSLCSAYLCCLHSECSSASSSRWWARLFLITSLIFCRRRSWLSIVCQLSRRPYGISPAIYCRIFAGISRADISRKRSFCSAHLGNPLLSAQAFSPLLVSFSRRSLQTHSFWQRASSSTIWVHYLLSGLKGWSHLPYWHSFVFYR